MGGSLLLMIFTGAHTSNDGIHWGRQPFFMGFVGGQSSTNEIHWGGLLLMRLIEGQFSIDGIN